MSEQRLVEERTPPHRECACQRVFTGTGRASKPGTFGDLAPKRSNFCSGRLARVIYRAIINIQDFLLARRMRTLVLRLSDVY